MRSEPLCRWVGTCVALAVGLFGCFPVIPLDVPDRGGGLDVDGDGSSAAEDCDDRDASISPLAEEVCNGVDDDCDGEVDEGLTETYFVDNDRDGVGTAASPEQRCGPSEGYSLDDGDCDDSNSNISPLVEEVCNGLDDDCDGEIDDGVQIQLFVDSDGDGFGDPDGAVWRCEQTAPYVLVAGDCDDSDPLVNPDATEVCGGLDEDCDGLIDDEDLDLDASDGMTVYVDADGDGYGDEAEPRMVCAEAPGFAVRFGDCDDANPDVNPDAVETCSGQDDDCDGRVDDADDDVDLTSASEWYRDGDGDGFGSLDDTILACTEPSGAVSDSSDCDDSSAAISPSATEVCNGTDDDCDGDIDDADGSLDLTSRSTWYLDADGDGYGSPAATVEACQAPSAYVASGDDCDDSAADVSPAASEVCNGTDDDCDGDVDDDDVSLDSSTASEWFVDADGDGFGDPGIPVYACSEPSGVSAVDTDCDDSESGVNPAATETCNGYDDDCDAVVDSASLCPCSLEYRSGDLTHPYLFCDTVESWSSAQSDCASVGYSLATVETPTEDAWINAVIDSYSTRPWWIGLNDITTEASWVWDSGVSSSYARWGSGQPDNWQDEDCVETNTFHPTLGWNDADCGLPRRYVCESW